MTEIIRGSALLALLFVLAGSFGVGVEAWVNGDIHRRRDRLAGRALGCVLVVMVWTVVAFAMGSKP